MPQRQERFYPQFEAAYEEYCQERCGFGRPVISTVVQQFLECGDLQQGFARVRCPECGHELFATFSSRGVVSVRVAIRNGPCRRRCG